MSLHFYIFTTKLNSYKAQWKNFALEYLSQCRYSKSYIHKIITKCKFIKSNVPGGGQVPRFLQVPLSMVAHIYLNLLLKHLSLKYNINLLFILI